MRKGLSPIVAVVLLIAISVVAAVGLYFYAAGITTKQTTTETPIAITATPIDPANGVIAIANLGDEALTLSSLQTTDGTECDFGEEVTIEPGEQAVCTMPPKVGSTTLFASDTGSAIINVAASEIAEITFQEDGFLSSEWSVSDFSGGSFSDTEEGSVQLDLIGVNSWTNITDPTPWSDHGYAIATDSSDNIFITGASNGEIYTMKFDSSGNHIWTNITNPTANNDEGYGIATDLNGDVVVTGYSDMGAVIGNVIYTMKLNGSDGSNIWTNITEVLAFDSVNAGYAITTDSGNNVIMTGVCEGCAPAGSGKIYTTKFDSGGNPVWTDITAVVGSVNGRGIVTDSNDDIIVTGACSSCGPTGNSAAYTMKLNGSDGSNIWTNISNTVMKNDEGYGIAIDSNDDVIITGFSYVGFETGEAIYTMKLNGSDGSHIWTNITDGPSPEYGQGIATNSNNDVIVTGFCDGCGTEGGYAIYTMKLNGSDGSHIWTNITDPTNDDDRGYGITTDSNDNIFVTGSCKGCGGVGSYAIYTFNLTDGYPTEGTYVSETKDSGNTESNWTGFTWTNTTPANTGVYLFANVTNTSGAGSWTSVSKGDDLGLGRYANFKAILNTTNQFVTSTLLGTTVDYQPINGNLTYTVNSDTELSWVALNSSCYAGSNPIVNESASGTFYTNTITNSTDCTYTVWGPGITEQSYP